MQEDKKRIEAILYTTGNFMSIEEIAKHCNLDPNIVKNIILALKKEYEEKDSALTIQQENDKFKLNIKKQYIYLVNKLVSKSELDSPTTKTLAVIAYKHPVKQSEIIKIRGNKAYDHIKNLIQDNFISSEKFSHTFLLKLTAKFYDYFDTSEEEIKNQLKNIDFKKILQELPFPHKNL